MTTAAPSETRKEIMRTITDHIVEGDSVNHQLKISVLDQPGQGGASHLYMIEGLDRSKNAEAWHIEDWGYHPWLCAPVLFQNGPIKEFGVNGTTQEALLAIIIDRLRSFQSGPYSCRDNAIALTHCEDALMWLQRRTRERIKRGVEGTNQK